MASITQFQKITDDIDKRIKAITDKNPKLIPITDGIINIEKYHNAKYKILWILKEPYYDSIDMDGNISGGGWDIKKVYNAKTELNGKKGFNAKTFFPMIYTSWAILNDFTETRHMVKDINDKSAEMIDAFKSTAYINIKKIPGQNTSNAKTIEQAYINYKQILTDQIKGYEPDIIICGSTFTLLLNDIKFDLKDKTRNKIDSEKHIKNYRLKEDAKQLFINAYHPANWRITKEQYCNDIINVVKKNHEYLR